MANFFDRFRDLDHLKEQAEELLAQVGKESKRQTALAKLRMRIFDLERRMNAEFRVLGERVWELHQVSQVTPENLAGAFSVLEALADEIADAKDELQELIDAAGRDEEVELQPTAEPVTVPDPDTVPHTDAPLPPDPLVDEPESRRIEHPTDPPME